MANRVYVRNLANGSTEESIRSAFAQAGEVSAVQLIKNRQTGTAGFAFVTMNSPEDAMLAIAAMNGAVFDGRSLRVSRVVDREGGAARAGSQAGRLKHK